MRELSRFRSEFNESYSLRSKLKKTHDVSEKIEALIEQRKEAIGEEK